MFWFDFDRDGDVDGMDFALGGMFLGFMEDNERAAKREALSAAGIDEYDLEAMSDRQRRATLEQAGLDPYDYD